MSSEENQFSYGGQAVMEGVMMRGSNVMAVAVRQPDGNVVLHSEDLNPRIYHGPLSRIPFLRALTSLWDVLVLGIRTLMYSADVALGEDEEVSFDGPIGWGTLAFSLILGIGLFFVVPLLLVGIADRYITSSFLSNVVEGLIRLLMSDQVEPVNLGNPDEYTIREFAEVVNSLTDNQAGVTFIDRSTLSERVEDDPKVRRPDITRAQTTLGWEPTIHLQEGLRKTIEYFRAKVST